jgi:hypothetical protein
MLPSFKGTDDMKTAERTGAPALGNALGYFAAFYIIDKYDWLSSVNTEIAVAMMGTIFIHVLMEFRDVVHWVANRFPKKQ